MFEYRLESDSPSLDVEKSRKLEGMSYTHIFHNLTRAAV